MKNDAALFVRANQVEAAWQLLTPVLEAWAAAPPGISPITLRVHGDWRLLRDCLITDTVGPGRSN